MRTPSPLTLGTAQFGLDYGIANVAGRLDEAEVLAILDAAWSSGITCIDTAHHYGSAEARVGSWADSRGRQPLIVTKCPSLRDLGDEDAAAAIARGLEGSLAALNRETVDAYLLHDPADLARSAIVAAISSFVDNGRVLAFGLSVYEEDDINAALSVPNLSVIQAPVSVLDQRLVRSGAFDRCAQRGITLFARSAFLQGLMFLSPDTMPPYFAAARQPIARLCAIAEEAKLPLSALALAALRGEPAVSSIVIGVTSLIELQDNLAAFATNVPESVLIEARRVGFGLGAEILDPRRWP